MLVPSVGRQTRMDVVMVNPPIAAMVTSVTTLCSADQKATLRVVRAVQLHPEQVPHRESLR